MTLLDQLTDSEFQFVKALLADQYAWILKHDLRRIPALPPDFLLGEVAIEVLKLRIATIQSTVGQMRGERANEHVFAEGVLG